LSVFAGFAGLSVFAGLSGFAGWFDGWQWD